MQDETHPHTPITQWLHDTNQWKSRPPATESWTVQCYGYFLSYSVQMTTKPNSLTFDPHHLFVL